MHDDLAKAASSASSENLQGRLLREQIQTLCRHSQSALITSIFTGLFVCWILYQDQRLLAVLAWYTLMIVVTFGRMWLQGAYRFKLPQLDQRYANLVVGAAAIGGFTWGAPAIWMIPSAPSAQVVLGIFLVGLAAVSFISLTPLRHAYTAFVCSMMLPIALVYFRIGNEYAYTAIGTIAFTVVMALAGYRQTREIASMLSVQLENAALASRLQKEKDIVEHANRELEREVAQRQRTEAELLTAKTEAEQANRAKSQFMANMSHELRTPLNGVLGMSDLLIRSLNSMPANSKSLKYATTIRTAGTRLLDLINDILDMTRIEAGALRFENAAFDPRRLIAEVVDLLNETAEAKGLKIIVDVAPQVPDEVRGDANRVRQIVTNLVSNAIKFTESGSVTIELVRAISDMPTNTTGSGRLHLLWSVSDTGIGIPNDAIGKLFQPFSQVDSSNTRRYGGSGLGLAISYQLVQALGGRIGVDTTEGRGSRFWFEMPFERVHQAKAKGAQLTPAERGLVKGRVLVAEDNQTNAQLVAEMLDIAGCERTIVHNGRAALAKLADGEFDLVLMDWHMPELDGVEATKAWRTVESTRNNGKRVPIIALTASVLPGDREACLAAGMDDFIPKPVSYEDLVTKLRAWLPAHSAERAAALAQ